MKPKIHTLSGTPEEFFCGGIEDSFCSHVRPGFPERPMDEFELMRVYKRFRKYLNHVAKLEAGGRNVHRLRTGAPWHMIETVPGVYNWSWMDKFVNHANKLGIDLIVDIVHYATPLWMEQSFDDPQYPERVAAFAKAFATRYKDRVKHYTPANEPGINSLMCGANGAWKPYMTGSQGFVRVLTQLAKGIQQTVKAIRSVQPDAVMFAVEATGYFLPLSEAAIPAAKANIRRDLLCWDLVHGKVDINHELYAWLRENNVSAEALTEFQTNAVKMDILGVNYYPWSSRTIDVKDGRVVEATGAPDGRLLGNLLRECYEYTGAPLWVTETSAHGVGAGSKTGAYRDKLPEQRIKWLDDTLEACGEVRKQGIPLLGYTQFPLFSMIDWEYRGGDGLASEYLINLGIYDVKFKGVDDIRITESPAVARFKHHLRTFEAVSA